MNANYNSNLVKNLPDAYKKTSDSNNYKILEIERLACKELRDRLQDISDILDINNATGKTLDMYGERVGQSRGIAADEKYILMIKSKIMRNISNGSYPSILNAICETLDCEPSQVLITEDEEACTITVVTLPLSVIVSAGLTTSQTAAIIKALLPVGITLKTFLFEGTFEFSASENEADNNKGFSDADGTVGGYFGATQGDETEDILPI